jgi:hypothetical protein
MGTVKSELCRESTRQDNETGQKPDSAHKSPASALNTEDASMSFDSLTIAGLLSALATLGFLIFTLRRDQEDSAD